jgi:hypothetical protein
MKGIPIITKVAAFATVIIAAAAAFVLPAGADVGILSPPIAAVQIGSPATLGTRGVTVTVPITVLCADGGDGFLQLGVTEAVNGNIARGFEAVATGRCTGNFQTVNVTVVADEHPFRRGTALATAEFVVCDFSSCLFSTHEREIRIGR